MNINSFKRLTQVGYKYGTDKAYFHLFTEFYHDYFQPYVDKEFYLLELGIFKGASLKMLQEFFPKAHIYSVDIDEKAVYTYYGDRIHTYLCSQVDKETLGKIIGNKKFDIIIDDGSHITSHQQISLGFLFPYLQPKGIYVCEDIHTSLNRSYVDSTESTLDIFKRYKSSGLFYCDLLNTQERNYLENNMASIDIYYKNHHALQCYHCKEVNHSNAPICICGTVLDYNLDKSITSIILHK
jgi:hypothetical protein